MVSKAVGSLILAMFVSFAGAQTTTHIIPPQLNRYGTCATTILAPFGVAFIIDSRITSLRNGETVSQSPGCKVLLARPTILLAGVGLEDSTGYAGHWNSLDEASAALGKLPESPTADQLKQWSMEWGTSLVNHYRLGGETPSAIGLVSETLLITRVGDEFYFNRAGVTWDGEKFNRTKEGQRVDLQHPEVEYAGLCRQFIVHPDLHGQIVLSLYPHTPMEDQRLDYWGHRKTNAQTVDDLVAAADGLESVLTAIDVRLQGERAVIAPPYATAQWSYGDKGWSTKFNSECESSVHKSAVKAK